MAKRRRRVIGLVPRLGRLLLSAGRWGVRHPQPAIVVCLTAAAAWGLWGWAQHADAFHIDHVQLPPNSTLKLRHPLIGESLWAVDLGAIADDLQRQQPWLKEVRVIRQLPNTIRVEAIARTPIAQVHLREWYPVDREGFIIPRPSASPSPDLMRLAGFERAQTPLRVGAASTDERMLLALRVLKLLRRTSALVSRRLTEVNVADLQQIRFVIDGDIEVRCGSEGEMGVQLDRLRDVLKVVAKRQVDVRYIDVRFKEPIVAPRT